MSCCVRALPLLLPVMAGVFALFARLLGAEAGYLLGFGFYWLFWCLLVPRRLLGAAEFGGILALSGDLAPRLLARVDRTTGVAWSVWLFLLRTCVACVRQRSREQP